ncbi:vWA domain-containing protein [Nonomuraea sp. NPDC002799]
MTAPQFGSVSHLLHVVLAGGPLAGQRIGVAPGDLPGGERPALLSVDTGMGLALSPVRLLPLAEVPTGGLAVSEELAPAVGLDSGRQPAGWWLEFPPVTPIRRLRLEMATETQLDHAVRELAESGLAGRLLWVPPGEQGEAWLDVNGLPYRVQHLDVAGQRAVLAELTAETEVELFAPGARNGVDIVVLADCSGSMSVPDIPPYGEPGDYSPRTRRQRRDESLRMALYHLLDMRLQISGRISRLAMVAFTERTTQIFPRVPGMAELDSSSAAAAEEFRMAITSLRAMDGGTDIGNALHQAANLLYLYGKPGNDRLIVLVSDGAHWAPKGDQGLGEVVLAAEEPVSLMEHLHRDMKIRLHAVGISTPQLYHDYVRAGGTQSSVLEPNHGLLQELVHVGGGDTAAIGGVEVLRHYFSGLGSGMSRRVPLRAAVPHARVLPPEVAAALSRIKPASGRWEHTLDQLADRLHAACGDVLLQAEVLSSRTTSVINRRVRAVQDPDFMRDVVAVFRPKRTGREGAEPAEVMTHLDSHLEALNEQTVRDVERRIAWLGRLAELIEELARRLAAAPAPAPAPVSTVTDAKSVGFSYLGEV